MDVDVDDLVAQAKAAYEATDLERAEMLLEEAGRWSDSEDVWINLGLVRMRLGKYEAAVQAYSRSEELPGEGLVNRGLCYERLGHREAARADYRAALEVRPDDVDALVNLGTLELEEQDPQAALRYLERAADIDPTTNWQLGDVFTVLDDLESAARVFRAAVNAGERRALLDLARVECDRENYEDAEFWYRRAAEEGIAGAAEELAEFLEVENAEYDDDQE